MHVLGSSLLTLRPTPTTTCEAATVVLCCLRYETPPGCITLLTVRLTPMRKTST